MRTWRNWYTRRIEVPVGASPWRFKSSRPHHARLAQLVERLIDVEDVVGSSPAARTFSQNKKAATCRGSSVVEHIPEEDVVVGSIPTRGTIIH